MPEVFPVFHQHHGRAMNCEMPSAKVRKAYASLLPDLLLKEWGLHGWCSYSDGFLWLVNPDDFRDELKNWAIPDESAIFLRTGFGDMFYWNRVDGVHMIDIDYGTKDALAEEIDYFFEYVLGPEGMLDKVLNQKIFNKALKRLGPPARNECYGYFPTIALGGTHDPANLKRVKLREHLSIVSQLHK